MGPGKSLVRGAIVVTLGLVGSASCAAFVDFGEFSGGREGDAATDGASPPSDAGDSSVSVTDAGADAAFCRTRAYPTRYCSDFDDPDAALPRLEQDHGNVVFDTTSAMSPPRSVLITAEPTANDSASAGLDLDLGAMPRVVRAELDLRVLEHASDYTEAILFQADTGGAAICAIYFILADATWRVRSVCGDDRSSPSTNIPMNQWERVTFVIDTTAGSGTVTVGRNAQSFAVPTAFANGTLKAVVGLYFVKAGHPRARVGIDNLAIGND